MTSKQDWEGQVGDVWALEWQRTDRSFAELNEELIARAVALAEDNGSRHILDIGCGAGSTSLALADRIQGAKVLGIDVSPALIEISQSRVEDKDLSCRFQLSDAAIWSNSKFKPDLLFSRHGVMFFDDPEGAFTHLANVARPGGKIIFSCFRSPAENAWAAGLSSILTVASRFNPDAPGPFAFAHEDKVRRLLSVSGWLDIEAEPVDFRYVAGAGINAVTDAIGFFNRIGPVARALREATEGDRQVMLDKLQLFVEQNHLSGRVAFPAAAWIFTATRPKRQKK